MEPTSPLPPPARPEPGGRSLIPIILVTACVLALAGAAVLVVQLLNRPGSAEDVAVDFVVAAYEGDAERACQLLGPDLRQVELERSGADNCADFARVAAESGDLPDQSAADVEVLESEVSGDTASVRVSAPNGSAGVWQQVELERHDEEWLVSSYSG